MVFKSGSKAPTGANGKPATGGVPRGGYGSGGAPSRSQKTTAPKNKPSGGGGSYGKAPSHKPKGGYGSHGKTAANKPAGGYGTYGKSKVTPRSVGSDGMGDPSSPIPRDQKKGRFNLPKGKFTY